MLKRKTFLVPFGVTQIVVNSGILLLLHRIIKYHGVVQLTLIALGVVVLVYALWRGE